MRITFLELIEPNIRERITSDEIMIDVEIMFLELCRVSNGRKMRYQQPSAPGSHREKYPRNLSACPNTAP